MSGVALAELLLSLPVLAALGLGGYQAMLVMLWRNQLVYAVEQGARAGSVAHADPQAIRMGLGRGLAPLLFGASDAASQAQAQAKGLGHVGVGQAAGWLQWRQLSPTAASFADWAVPAVDASGQTLAGVQEIPIDAMAVRTQFQQPATGRAGLRGSEPIGASSLQTLADASVLKIEMTYWVPLQVPGVGAIAARVARAASRCTSQCALYFAPDVTGRAIPRWPIRVASTHRMLTAPRQAGVAPAGSVLAHASLGTGMVDAANDFAPVPISVLNPKGISESQDQVNPSQTGFLQMGGQVRPAFNTAPSPAGQPRQGLGQALQLGSSQPGVCVSPQAAPSPFSGLGR